MIGNKFSIYMVEKIIHQIVGKKNRNALIERCMKSWKILGDYGFEFKIWNDQSIHTFLRSYYRFALSAVQNARNYAEAADIARYLIIHHYGGYYMDWDIQMLDRNGFFNICDMAH